MLSRIRISMIVALLLSLIVVIPAFAGGWAVITLDRLPFDIIAGEPVTIGFTVLQHGRTPMADLQPTITAKRSDSEIIVVNAEPDGKVGHYTATLMFPKEGNWQWSIDAFTMNQTMPELNVAASTTVSVNEPAVQTKSQVASISLLLVTRILAVGIGLVGLMFAVRRKSRIAMALTVMCLLVGVASFMTGTVVPAVEAQSKSSDDSKSVPSISQAEYGKQLFVAKGCITCHYNSKAASSTEYWTIDMGAPNLSKFSASPEALRLRLKDPSSVKSDTKMPNLHLADDEIEALIAFINSK